MPSNSSSQHLSQAKFARRLSVSRKTVSMWKSKGLLVVNDTGQVDVEASLAHLRDRPSRYRGGVTTPVEAVTRTGNADEPGNSSPAEAAPDAADFGLDDPELPTAEAVRRKENFIGLLRRHEYRVAQGEYVRKADVKKHFSTAFTGFRRQIQSMPPRFASEAAARLGCDAGALQVEMDRMIATTLGEMSAPVTRG